MRENNETGRSELPHLGEKLNSQSISKWMKTINPHIQGAQ